MICPHCRATTRDGVMFCEECGTQMPRACPRCGAPLADKKFCGSCGFALTDPAPHAYTPPHIAQRILKSRSALEGERKQVTVLFCDIVDSSRLAERLDPEAMHALMDRVLRLMAEAVHRYEGTVNQFLGDGLMALFGAPAALEDHAVRAVESALAIQETIGGLAEQIRRDSDIDLRLRIGLNTGLVVVGAIGDDLRMDYTAVGDTTHLASRMQALADPGTILMTAATQQLVEGYVRHEGLGPMAVKGRAAPVVVYRVTGRHRRRSRLEIRAERGLSPFVGRRAELALLHACLERAKAGRGVAVGIVGEAGAGKSRLMHEFRATLHDQRLIFLEGRCVADGRGTPLLPIREMLRSSFRIDDTDVPLQIREKLRAGVHALDGALGPTLPFIGELLGAPDESGVLSRYDPKERGQRTFGAISALSVAASRRCPHVFFLEDLHWCDKSTEDYFFKFVVESLATSPILLVTTHRPGYAIRWADRAHHTSLALDLLSREEAHVLTSSVLRTRHVPEGVSTVVWQKAEGNPLFIEELVRSLREHGAVVERGDEVEWRGDPAGVLPGTVQDIIRARIDRLDEPVKRAALAASAIGREFTLRLLAALAETPDEASAHVDALLRHDLVQETASLPEIKYAFKHAIIQEVAYEGLLLQHRRDLHGRIAMAIEALYADRLEDQAPLLAYHYARSASRERAVPYALLAGDRAVRIYANAEAVAHFSEALAIARSLPDAPAVARQEIDAVLKLAAVGTTRQDVERDQKNLEQAYAHAERLADGPRLARVLYWLGRTHYVMWEPNAAIQHAQRSLEIAETLNDEALAAPPVNLMGRVYLLTSQFAKASQMLERSVTQMRALGNRVEESTSAGLAGTMMAFRGDFRRALEYVDDGLRLAAEIENPFAEAAAWYYRGTVWDQRGDWTAACADYDRAVELARKAGDPFREYIVKCWQGRALVMAGDPRRGRALIEESLAISERIGTKLALSWQRTWLAACLLALGEVDAVAPLCAEAIGLADAAMDRFNKALAHRTLAEALAFGGASRSADADQAFVTAIAIQEEIGSRPEQARSELSYARFLRGIGAVEQSEHRFQRARGMFEEMGMDWDLRQAVRDSAPLA